VTGLSVSVVEAGALTVELVDGPARFHAIWLRDNARGEASRDGANDQRLFDVSELPEEVVITAAEVVDGNLRVEFGPDGVVSTFEVDWLEAHRYDGVERRSPVAVPWLAADLDPCRLAWSRRDDPSARSATTRALVRDGLAIVHDLARGHDATGPSIGDVAGIWGPIRETNYGEVFHVRAEADPVNLAFTPRALNVHTDNPYRCPVPGFQLLHCLVASEAGGVTVLVDGFMAAEALRAEDQGAFDLLAGHRVPFRWRGGGFDLWNRSAVIEVDDRGELLAVRYNNRSAAPFDMPFEEMSGYYEAYRCFARLLHRPELEFRFTLSPGECLVFDNERVLHGREGESDPERYLQGCYLDRDWVHGSIGEPVDRRTP
jgi:gamma-butyrobetaine dioxygenase